MLIDIDILKKLCHKTLSFSSSNNVKCLKCLAILKDDQLNFLETSFKVVYETLSYVNLI